MARMGKGWAKGLTAATDARIAAAAAGHRGKRYRPRKTNGVLRRSGPLDWSPGLAYVVGLLATDGCLVSGRTQIAFVSKDLGQCVTVLRLLGRSNEIRESKTRVGSVAYRVQFGDAELYRWLLTIGLSPRKSLTLGALRVPDEHFLPLVRGLLDGDGSIINKVYRADTGAPRPYYWEYLQTRFVSASIAHLTWVASALQRIAGITGYLHRNGTTSAGNPMYELRYGKPASIDLLQLLYHDADAPCLERKRAIWSSYAARHAVGPARMKLRSS